VHKTTSILQQVLVNGVIQVTALSIAQHFSNFL